MLKKLLLFFILLTPSWLAASANVVISFGDHSGSNSESYQLNVVGSNVNYFYQVTAGKGAVVNQPLTLPKGSYYIFLLHNVGASDQPPFDFDYTLLINHTGGGSISKGGHTSIEGVFGVSDGAPFGAAGKYIVLSVSGSPSYTGGGGGGPSSGGGGSPTKGGTGNDAPGSADTDTAGWKPETRVTETEGDPVNLFTGAFSMAVTDLRIPGRGIDFVWTRHHDSNMGYGILDPLGSAWSSPYLQKLFQYENGSIDYISGTGRVDHYPFIDGVEWGDAAHENRDLIFDSLNSEFVMTTDGDMKYIFYDFNSEAVSGFLKRIEDRLGNRMEFHYLEGRLTSIVDTFGRVITLSHDADGRITEITDFDNRVITYEYYQTGDTEGVVGQLKSVKAPHVLTSFGNNFLGSSRKTTTYTYNVTATNPLLKNNIVQIIDPKGQNYLTNTYEASESPSNIQFNSVIAQRYGDASNNTYHYHWEAINETIGNDTATLLCTVNDRRGLVKEVRLNAAGNPLSVRRHTGFADPNLVTTSTNNRPQNPLRASDPAFFETRKTFDAEGKILTLTKSLGNQVTYTYPALPPSDRHGEDNPESITQIDEPISTLSDLTTAMTYEDEHQLIKTYIDPNGQLYTYFYDYEEGLLGQDLNGDTQTDQTLGLLVRIEYPTITQGLAATEAGGSQTISGQFQYNSFGQLTRQIDGEGKIIDYIYYPESDPDGDDQNLTAGKDLSTGGYLQSVIVDPEGLALTTTYEYDPVGNVVAIIDPRGHRTEFEVNSLNQVVKITSPAMTRFPEDDGATYEKRFYYDANDNVVEIWVELENSYDDADADVPGFSDPTHFEMRFEYDILDNVIAKTVEVSGHPELTSSLRTEYAYDPSENLQIIRYPNLDEDRMSYDERDLLYQTFVGDADPVVAKSITTFNYDENGNLFERDHPLPAHLDRFTYDGFERLSSHSDVGIATTTSYTYDPNSNVTQVDITGAQDGLGNQILLSQTTIDHDEINRPFRTRYAIIEHPSATETGQAETQVKYDRNHLTVKTVNPNLHDTLFTYDKANRLKTSTDASSNQMTLHYDSASNITQVATQEVVPSSDSQTFHLNYRYDELNRLRETEDDLAHLTRFTLDSRGLPRKITDAAGNSIERQFDGLNRKLAEYRDAWQSGQIVLSWRHDERSRLTKFIDGLNRETRYQYDSHNRLEKRINADATTRLYQYDTEDNLTRLTRENSHLIDFEYDNSNRLIARRFKDASEVLSIEQLYEYNGLNSLTKISETGSNEITYGLDSRGLALTCSQRILDTDKGTYFSTKVFTMTYDDVGNPKSLLYPSSRLIEFHHNNIELLTRLTTQGFEGSQSLITYDYEGYGRVANKHLGSSFKLEVTYDAIKRVKSYLHKNLKSSLTRVGFFDFYDPVHNRRGEIILDDAN